MIVKTHFDGCVSSSSNSAQILPRIIDLCADSAERASHLTLAIQLEHKLSQCSVKLRSLWSCANASQLKDGRPRLFQRACICVCVLYLSLYRDKKKNTTSIPLSTKCPTLAYKVMLIMVSQWIKYLQYILNKQKSRLTHSFLHLKYKNTKEHQTTSWSL